MLKNILKIMLRNMRKHRVHAVINITGLALGLACFLVIALYVRHELSYDKMFSGSSSLYRITMSSTVGGTANFIPTEYPAMGPEIASRFPGIKAWTRIINYKYTRYVPTLQAGEHPFYEENVIFADSSFFSVFDFPLLAGNAKTALQNPASIVITEKMAQKYFGTSDVLGKHLKFNNKTELEVTAVLKDIPSSTHLQFDFLIPMSGIGSSGALGNVQVLDSWNMDWFWTYLSIPDKAAVPGIAKALNTLAAEKIPDFQRENDVKFYLQPVTDVHLYSHFDYNTDIVQNGDSKTLYIFISVGVLVLAMSAINFINITLATAARRYKEIGISKVLGAVKSQLRFQFLFESVIVCLASFIVSLLLVQLLLPLFSGLLNVPLSLNYASDAPLLLALAGFAVLVGAASGAYPAFFVSAFEPQQVLKGIWRPGHGGSRFRKLLVGIQIGVSVFLIIGTIVIWQQLNFIQDKSLGYDQDQIIMLRIRGTSIVKSYHAFKNSLLAKHPIISVSSVSEPVGREVQFMTFNTEGKAETQNIKILNVTHDFVATMGLQIVQGRDFSRDHITDSTSGFLLNEAAAAALGWSDPVGKAIDHSFRKVKNGSVIGVVKDFNFEPLQKKIDPIVIWFGMPYWYAAVRVEKGKAAEALAVLENEWKRFEPEKPFAFQFLDQAIQHVYEKEHRLSKVFMAFSLLSIAIAVMGLFGLIAFIAEQRLSEIGIRKVMGASVRSILILLSREYFILVVAAFVFAAPLSYYVLNVWLQGFAFRVAWSPLYFAAGLVLTAVIVVMTVVLKAMGAARTNPAKTLRAE